MATPEYDHVRYAVGRIAVNGRDYAIVGAEWRDANGNPPSPEDACAIKEWERFANAVNERAMRPLFGIDPGAT